VSTDKRLKSAYELAMERLRAKDREDGIDQDAPLDDAQKAEITELRRQATAKLAEIEILWRDRRKAAVRDAEQAAELERQYAADRSRVQSGLESAIARVRHGKSARDED